MIKVSNLSEILRKKKIQTKAINSDTFEIKQGKIDAIMGAT